MRIGQENRAEGRKKVVLFRELHKAIIYTTRIMFPSFVTKTDAATSPCTLQAMILWLK
jgi:hypothetical protein